jgi:NIPSNAP
VTNLIELRQYLLRPGQRDTLIEVFDRQFIEPQEAVGIDVLGQFRDPERPDHFVWLRGFPDLDPRHESLTRFHDGPVWAAHRDVARHRAGSAW